MTETLVQPSLKKRKRNGNVRHCIKRMKDIYEAGNSRQQKKIIINQIPVQIVASILTLTRRDNTMIMICFIVIRYHFVLFVAVPSA